MDESGRHEAAPDSCHNSGLYSIQRLLELKTLHEDEFVTIHELWHPPKARGVYGGILIAQSLVAAQRTVSENFRARSMRCHFLHAAQATSIIHYKVSRISAAGSNHIRSVSGRQGGYLVFIATVRFAPEDEIDSGHYHPCSKLAQMPPQMDFSEGVPFLLHETVVANPSDPVERRRKESWLRPLARMPDDQKQCTHDAVIAFLSDSYFITTAAQVHGLNIRHREARAGEQLASRSRNQGVAAVGMMVSLDHVIYFHSHAICDNDWVFARMECLWAGHERALVRQHMYTEGGVLLATCLQEVSGMHSFCCRKIDSQFRACCDWIKNLRRYKNICLLNYERPLIK